MKKKKAKIPQHLLLNLFMIIFNLFMIIANIQNFIQRVIKNSEDDFYHVIHGCSRCGYGGNLHRHASYHRTVICMKITARVRIQRVICPGCKKTHAIIPSDLIPYFQHTIRTIITLLDIIESKKLSYSKIITEYRKFSLSFSLGHISLYFKRFKTNMCKITYYFRTYCNIFLEPTASGADIIKILNNFNLETFNAKYSSKMDSYFLSKVVINN